MPGEQVLEPILLGGGFAFAAALQPGPLQAYLLSSVTQHGWRRTLPAAFSPLVTDGPIALASLLLLHHVPGTVLSMLQAAGGILLLWFAWAGYRQWKRGTDGALQAQGQNPRTLLQAAAVNILNPNPYLGWMLVLGPAFLAAWHRTPAAGVALVISFYGTTVVALAGTIVLFGTSRFLTPRSRRLLLLVSALLLAVLGAVQLVTALARLAGPGSTF